MLTIENCAAEITNVNARKELNGEERVPAFDINVSMRVAAEMFKGLLPDYDTFISMFWDKHKALRCSEVKMVTFDNIAFQDGLFLLKDKYGHVTEYTGVKVGKFKFYPQNLQIARLDFQIQYSAEREEEIIPAYKAEQQEGVLVTIQASPKDKKDKGDADSQDDMFMRSETADEAEEEAA